ncbi:MAG: orotate phosphoribosyltransferase [Candidatus Neomarinimicrobiota bacterium]|nr:orotate phosphoribosyltransferase [Candidatus Neomarinimicrobiota bacterium]
MDNKEYLNIFRKTGALMEGHFVLTSGRHSRSYFQCAKVLQYPQYLNLFSKIISDHFKTFDVNTVISPAVGGIVIGTRVGGDLDKRTIFAERENGEMVLRRGFSISPGEKVLVVEDVITTGGSVKEVMQVVEELGGQVVGVGIIVDRSNGNIIIHDNQFSIVKLEVESFAENEIPEDLAKMPIQKPGSRSLKN